MDFNKDEDVKELMERIDMEDPYFLTGSPPFQAFSKLIDILRYSRDPKKY